MTPIRLAPIKPKGTHLKAGEWVIVVLLALCYVVPGAIAFIFFYTRKMWVCPSCGHYNVLKSE
jgi:hypothetical protein